MLVCVEEINSVAKGEAFVTVERAVEWNESKIFNFPSFFIVEKKKALIIIFSCSALLSVCHVSICSRLLYSPIVTQFER